MISFLNLIYPPTCGICGKLNEGFLCQKCYNMLENQAEFIVEPNQDFEKNFDEHIFFFKYEGIIRKIILDYKFHDKSYLYKTLVNFLVKNKKFFKILKSYDTIVPVPISTKRKKVRGYNQSDLLAKELVKHTNNLKLENKCLYKTKNIIEQSKLNKESRKINIQGVYELKNMQKLAGKKILLLDDIYTTGSTANECCKVIKQANPKKIGILTIAKD